MLESYKRYIKNQDEGRVRRTGSTDGCGASCQFRQGDEGRCHEKVTSERDLQVMS